MESVVAVLSCESLLKEKRGRELLERVKLSENFVDVSNDKPASLVITEQEVYLSCISPSTLLVRSRQGMEKLNLLKNARHGGAQADEMMEGSP